jgi:hypothetical protein
MYMHYENAGCSIFISLTFYCYVVKTAVLMIGARWL